jgi:hypothetical protein
VRLEGLGQLRNPVTSPRIETTTSGLVAYYVKQLRYCCPVTTKFTADRNGVLILVCRRALYPAASSVGYTTVGTNINGEEHGSRMTSVPFSEFQQAYARCGI